MQETRRDFMKLVGGAVAAVGVVMAGRLDGHAAPMHSQARTKTREFKPGEKIPVSGMYDAVHDRIDGQAHAADHQLALIAGGEFPNCKACQGWVRFRLHQATQPVTYF